MRTQQTTTLGSHNLTREQGESWQVRAQRADFMAQPARVQTETLSRVLRLIEDEEKRGQVQPSSLKRLAPKIYGIHPTDLQ